MPVYARHLILLCSLLFCGCSFFIKEPQVTVTRANIIGLDTSGADIECALVIFNPNSFDLTLRGYTYDLRIMSLPLSSGGLQEALSIPAGKETDMRLPFRIKYVDLLEIIKRRPDPDRVPYRIQANLQLATPLGSMLIPIDKSDVLKIPENYRPERYLKSLLNLLP